MRSPRADADKPVTPRPPTAALAPVLVVLVVLGADVSVHLEARAHAKRGVTVSFSSNFFAANTPEAWLVGCLLLWVGFFPLYLASRSRTL